MREKSYGFHRFSSRLQYSFLNICCSSVFCRQNANRYLVCFGMSSIHEVMISLLNLPYMTCVFLSLCLQSWIIYIQWYVFRTWFVVTMPTDIAFILGCAVFMKLSWINQVSQALMVDHGLDWFTSDLLQPKEFREIKAYLPIKTFKLRKPFEQLLVRDKIF